MSCEEVDLIELYVEDVEAAARFHASRLGFQGVARGGPETGLMEQHSLLMKQGSLRLLLTEARSESHPAAEYVRRHGDGVADIVLRTRDAAAAFEAACRHGARPVREPTVLQDEHGRVMRATVAVTGDLHHSFVQREGPSDALPVGLRRAVGLPVSPGEMFSDLDHFAICIDPGTLEPLVHFYERGLGFQPSHEENVRTPRSGMNSKVVQNASGRICMVLMEPPTPERTGQIGEFLQNHGGPGVQHFALRTPDIIDAIRQLRTEGIEFLDIPASYYDVLEERLGSLEGLDLPLLRELDVLVDRDPHGLLLQCFTRSRHPRHTFFLEVVQRKAARGFGAANIRALFEAVEREHAILSA